MQHDSQELIECTHMYINVCMHVRLTHLKVPDVRIGQKIQAHNGNEDSNPGIHGGLSIACMGHT